MASISLARSIETLLAGTLVAVLLTAATAKTQDFKAFQTTLRGLGLRRRARSVIGASVVGAEYALGAAIAINMYPVVVAVLAAVLFTVFTVVSLYAASRKLSVTCGCFGASQLNLGKTTAIRSAILVTVAALYGVGATIGQTPQPLVAILVAAAAFGEVAWIVGWRRAGRPFAYR
jgi:hypothetical protein